MSIWPFGRKCRAELASLSNSQVTDMYWKKVREKTEPRMRKKERKLGSPDWETMSYMDLLDRQVARNDEARRPYDLRRAKRLGIDGAELMSTQALHWAVFDAEVRKQHVRDIC